MLMNILLTATFNRSLFVNGLNQNIVFLAEMLKDMGYNVSICVNHDVEECQDPPLDILIMEEHEIGDYEFDYILQTGSLLKKETIDIAKSKNPRCKHVHVHYGNRLMTDVELCDSTDKMALNTHKVDEVWVSPHYSFSIPYLQTFYNIQKVFTIPYIWSPKYMDLSQRYKPGQDKNIGVMEPNLNMTKNCLIPIYLTEAAYKQEPHLINRLEVHCVSKFREKLYFRSLMSKLDIVKHNKSFFGDRISMKDIFNTSNVIVSHQLLNSLNYVYLEALYLDIPIIHNSFDIKEVGYFYPGYDINTGAQQLIRALKFHDDNIDTYRSAAKNVLHKFSPNNDRVREQYRKLLS